MTARDVDPARLRTLARDCGAWLEIRAGSEVLGTVRGDLVRALLRVGGAAWTFDQELGRLTCSWAGTPRALGGGMYTTPGGRYSLRVQPPGAEATRRGEPVTGPSHYTPAERKAYDGASIGRRDEIAIEIKAAQKAARLEVERMERVEIWSEDLGAWFPPDWTPEQCRAWVRAHPEAYQTAHP